MKKCYDKHLEFVVPMIRCSMCKERIRQGDELHMVVLTWGNGKHTCKKCADEYEVDWSMHVIEDPDEDDDNL